MTREDVEHVAMLARLGLSEAEKERFQREMNQILDAFGALQQVETAPGGHPVEPTAHVVPLQNVLRSDEVRPSLPREEVLANAPDTEGEFFKVPRILEE
ncbi:glutamyl-tRNA amidotransferase subunit C [Limnochorda pilosa]|uniref:Aspartyl/glutamyl-tRNA(Asn/Gln) amidotransferase subunit C n=1 Tax=Limnochorda pilosa TaxID=1555112 RepID=A0A0K2SNF1_LIMPI|nr:glutamyl-tRNA amidotransferase subunit C [Limnochorda pilosa]